MYYARNGMVEKFPIEDTNALCRLAIVVVVVMVLVVRGSSLCSLYLSGIVEPILLWFSGLS